MKFTINIGTAKGTNHGSQSAEMSHIQVGEIVERGFESTDLNYSIDWKFSTGGDWTRELVAVIVVNINSGGDFHDFEDMWFLLKELVRSTDQDCIAIEGIKHTDGGYLLYHPNYTGERYAFDSKYIVR